MYTRAYFFLPLLHAFMPTCKASIVVRLSLMYVHAPGVAYRAAWKMAQASAPPMS